MSDSSLEKEVVELLGHYLDWERQPPLQRLEDMDEGPSVSTESAGTWSKGGFSESHSRTIWTPL